MAIPYQKFYLVDSKLWNSITNTTLIFVVDTYIETDTQNIISSLSRISKFIKQHLLDNKTKTNIPSIAPFSSTVWDLIQSIYKSGWDYITANDKKHSF